MKLLSPEDVNREGEGTQQNEQYAHNGAPGKSFDELLDVARLRDQEYGLVGADEPLVRGIEPEEHKA